MSQQIRNINYRKFYVLLKQLPHASKEQMVLDYTNNRTASLHNMQPMEYYNMLGAMEAMTKGTSSRSNDKQLDLPRKRLIASIGGYLVASGKAQAGVDNIKLIKAVACRAAKKERFNDIPADRLNSLYNAFNHRQKDIKEVANVDPLATVAELQMQLDVAVGTENYKLASAIKKRIEEL